MRRVVVPILSACLALTACSAPVAGFPRFHSPPAEAQLIQSAYDVLLNDYVLPLDPTVLGLAAATGMRDAVAAQEGAAAAQQFPYATFQGDGAAVRYEIAQQYEAVVRQYPNVNAGTLADDAMDRMAQSVGDCHTNFFTPT
jgi:C-terminal processing protease CtpA/Prc